MAVRLYECNGIACCGAQCTALPGSMPRALLREESPQNIVTRPDDVAHRASYCRPYPIPMNKTPSPPRFVAWAGSSGGLPRVSPLRSTLASRKP